jgi:hypothetical protein
MGNTEGSLKMDEPILDDNYPVFCTYWYLADGEPKRSPLEGNVRDLKREWQAAEIRRCAAIARNLPVS